MFDSDYRSDFDDFKIRIGQKSELDETSILAILDLWTEKSTKAIHA